MSAIDAAGRHALGHGVSRETLERLQVLAAAVEKWTKRINLIAPSTLPDIWRRHIADSAQLWELRPEGAGSWIDLGSGAGFPGLVVAAFAADSSPSVDVTLVESDQRKAAFLMTAAREMGLSVEVLVARIETLPARRFDVVSARALASLTILLGLARPFAGAGTVCLFPKGAKAESELTEARRDWHIEAQLHRSLVDPSSQIIEIREFSRVGTAEA